MADVVHHVDSGRESSFSSGVMIGIGLFIAVIALLLIFGLPTLRDRDTTPVVPEQDSSIPSEIDVNLNVPQGGTAPAP